MDSQHDDDEIDLLDLVAVLLRRKKMIVGVTVAGMAFAVAFAIGSLVLPPAKSYLPNKYTPKALMIINDASSSGGGLSSMLSSSGLGGLASLAGVNLGGAGSTYSQLAVYLAGINSFLDTVVDKFDLVTRYKIKKSVRAESRKALQKNLAVAFDDESGVFSIGFTDIDPVFAQSVVNYCVGYFEARFDEIGLDKNKLQKENLETNIANTLAEIRKLEKESHDLEASVSSGRAIAGLPSIMLESTRLKREVEAQEQVYTQLKIQYELLKVQMASETPVFQVLEYAEVPDKKSEPSRGTLCIIIAFASFFGAVMLAFVLDAIGKLRKDPEAMAKLSGASK